MLATPIVGPPLGAAIPAMSQEDFGYALQFGLQFNLDAISPHVFRGRRQILGAGVYTRGAVKANNGWDFNTFDCVWTAAGHCDKSIAGSVLTAFEHYWTPTLSSGFYGSYFGIYYSPSAIADFGGGVAVVNTDEYRVGSNLVWTPVKNFDLGGELMYLRDNHHSRPVGLAPDIALWASGLPSWKGVNATVEGRLRLQRSF